MSSDGYTTGGPVLHRPRFPRSYRLLWSGTACANLADGLTLAVLALVLRPVLTTTAIEDARAAGH